jgi:tRNA-dihydrouridine synthase
MTAVEIAKAAEGEGVDWITVHGRTRSEDYGHAVDLEGIRRVRESVKLPFLGNGNVYSRADRDGMVAHTGCDGVMIARGVLGNPWIFRDLGTSPTAGVTLDEWIQTVVNHVEFAREHEGEREEAAVTIRKHLLWYTTGWPHARKCRQEITQVKRYEDARELVLAFGEELRQNGVTLRQHSVLQDFNIRYKVPSQEGERVL